MLKRALVAVLTFSLASPTLVVAQQVDLQKAAKVAVKAVVEAEAQSQRPAARGENPYMLPGLILLGGGATLSVLGFVDKTGVECTGDLFTVDCGTKANKGLIVSGLAVAGVGAAVLVVGEGKRGMPSITAGPGRFVVKERVKF